MTKVDLLLALKDFTEATTEAFYLPTRVQSEDEEPEGRAPEVYCMRLPDSHQASKKAPYILHQIVTGKDWQNEGDTMRAQTVVRSIFCVYNEDEQEGGMALLRLMEHVRVELLKQVVLANRFELDTKTGVDMLVYPDDTAPYFIGEMSTTWWLPNIQRELLPGGKYL